MSFQSEWIKNNPVFSKLPQKELEEIARSADSRWLNKGEYLCMQGDVWPYVVFVRSGKMRWMMLSVGGKEHQLFDLSPNQVFWAHSFFDDEPMPASLQAASKTQVYLWNRSFILPYLYRHPEALFDVTRILTGIMRQAREIIYGLAFQPIAGRLANFIISSMDNQENPSLEREMTLEDIASVCATSSEVVCRLLYQFQTDGLLNITRTHITISDQDSLKRLAESD